MPFWDVLSGWPWDGLFSGAIYVSFWKRLSIGWGLALCSPSAFLSVRSQQKTRRRRGTPLWETTVPQRCGSEIESKFETPVGEQPCWAGLWRSFCWMILEHVIQNSKCLIPLVLHIYIGHWTHVGQRRCGQLEQADEVTKRPPSWHGDLGRRVSMAVLWKHNFSTWQLNSHWGL